jgi:ribokinase
MPDRGEIVVVGGANYDYLVRASRLPGPGDTVEGDMIDEAPGGKGANQAVAAARLGARVAFVGRIGSDERGERILAAFRREQVRTEYVLRDATAPTGVALIHVEAAGEKQIVAVPGANARLTSEDVRGVEGLIRGAKLLLLQLEVPLETVRTAVEIAREAGVRVLLDPAPPIRLPDDLLAMVDFIKPNSGEAGVLTGVRVTDRDLAREAARRLLERGVGGVAVAAGEEGTLAVSADRESWLPRLNVKSIDATGAGDAFAAALGVALAEGQDFHAACAFANAAAALATTIVGAQAGMPSRAAVLALLKEGVAKL